MIFTLPFFLISTKAHSYYLNTNVGAHFDDAKVNIYVTANSTCSNTGFNKEDILKYAVIGAEKLWNNVPTANIEVKKGGTLSTSDNKYITGELCLLSESGCSESTAVPSHNDIVIACNSNTTNFPNSQYLAISAPNNISSNKIKGSVILLNDTADSVVSTLSKAEMISLMAHEIGHALGLGHSKKSEALMYYKNSENRDRLSQDDIDGITYLYPNRLDGCTSFLGTIKDHNDNSGNFIINFLLGFFLILAYKKLVPRS